MSLTYQEILALCSEIEPLIVGSAFCGCGSIDANRLVLDLGSYHVLMCFQPPFLRFHLVEYSSSGHSPLAEEIKSALMGSHVKSIQVLNGDRIVEIQFSNGMRLIAEFFSKKANLHLVDAKNQGVSFLKPSLSKEYILPTKQFDQPQAPLPLISSASIASKYEEQEKSVAFNKRKQDAIRQLRRQYDAASLGLQQCDEQLKTANQWASVQHEGVLLQANMYKIARGMSKITVLDWENDNQEREILLDPLLDPSKQIEKRFKGSQRLRKAIPHLQLQLEKRASTVQLLGERLKQAEAACSDSELELVQPAQRKQASTKKETNLALPFHEFHSEKGLPIWVGKNAASNEKLTFSHAKGSDWWLHVRDFPGSHVVVRSLQKGQELDDETLQDAMQLALEFSKVKGESIVEVCLTQRKYVTKAGRGSQGKVQLSKHRVLTVRRDLARLKRVKQRV